jgi:hypothetical protein
MSPYADASELRDLQRHWLAAQARMLEAHEAAREFEMQLADGVEMLPEELVAKADLAARARDATEIWLRVDDRFRQASTDRDYIPVARGVR